MYVNAIFGIPFLSSIILFFHKYSTINKKIINTLIIFLTFSSLFYIVNYTIFKPYRLTPIYTQNQLIPEIGKGKNILFNIDTKTYIIEINNILKQNSFQPGDPIIALSRLPGLIYLLDGVSPGSILWSNNRYNAFSYNLNNSHTDYKKSVIILNEYDDMFINILKRNNNINFLEEYVKVREVVYGQNRYNSNDRKTNVYIHKSKVNKNY